MSLAREMEDRTLACALVAAYDGRSLAAAAAVVGVGLQRARRLLRRYKVPLRDRVRRQGGAIPSSFDPRTAADEEEASARRAALVALADGMSVRALAAAMGTSHASVQRLFAAAGIERRRGRPPSLDLEEVRRLRGCGWSYQDIADVHGCSREAVALTYRDGRRAQQRIDAAAVVQLRDEHHLTWADVGAHLGCHPDTAKKLYYAARRAQMMLAGSLGCSEA